MVNIIVGRWDHQLTHLHIHIDYSRNISLKITKIQNFISSLCFIRFRSKCSLFYSKCFTLSIALFKPGPDFPLSTKYIQMIQVRCSGVARIFPVGWHWGALGFRRGANILSWQAPPPPPLKMPHLKEILIFRRNKLTSKKIKVITFVGGGGGVVWAQEEQPLTKA